MESVGSNSTPHDHHNRRPSNPRFRVPHPVAGRIVRAIQNRLLLLHRSGPSFFVLGATGNVYNVTLSVAPSCTCPDRTAPCKHILFVLIRVLGVPLGDPCLHRKTLRPCNVDRLLVTPSLPGALAGAGLREMFHRHFYLSRQGLTQRSAMVHVEDGSICPICLDEITASGGPETATKGVVACGTCRNPIHEDCLFKWKRSRGRRPAICVICRARWRDIVGQEKYVNLAAYDMVADVSSLARYLSGHRTVGSESVAEKSTALITRDLLGGGSAKVESEELDLDLHVPSGWEKRLDLKSGKVYIQRCSTASLSSEQRNQAKLQDLNFPPSSSKLALNLFDELSLELKLVSSSSSSSSSLTLPFTTYQSVCTLDKVKSALERADRAPIKKRSPLWKSLQSPSCSSSSSCNKEIAQEQGKDEKPSSFSGSPVATGCPSCLAYVLVLESYPKCPRCNVMVPLLKKARVDLNISI